MSVTLLVNLTMTVRKGNYRLTYLMNISAKILYRIITKEIHWRLLHHIKWKCFISGVQKLKKKKKNKSEILDGVKSLVSRANSETMIGGQLIYGGGSEPQARRRPCDRVCCRASRPWGLPELRPVGKLSKQYQTRPSVRSPSGEEPARFKCRLLPVVGGDGSRATSQAR